MSAAAPPADAPIAGARLPPRELLGAAIQGSGPAGCGRAVGTRDRDRDRREVAVVGISSSSQANLLAEIDRLAPTCSPSRPAPASRQRVGPAHHRDDDDRPHERRHPGAAVYELSSGTVLRTPFVRRCRRRIGVDAADSNLPQVMGTSMASGHFLDGVSARYPEVVLGAQAAAVLQITQAGGHVQVYLNGTWFTVVGIMHSALLDTSLDSIAFISLPVAQRLFATAPNASEIYVRTDQNDVTGVANLLAPTADPQDPSGVAISRPSDVLQARAAAQGQFTTLLLGLGAVALLVGAIGIANIMVISVLERRGEIGLRRALGATRGHITLQFLTESALLAALGAIAGLGLGAAATEGSAVVQHQPFVVPVYALVAAPISGLLIGAVAGLYPAAKAARLSPTEALRT